MIDGKVLFDAPMKRYTSLRVGGPAECLLFPKDADELKRVVWHARNKEIPLFILGRGTNLIVRDKGIRGWVISLTQGMKRVRMEGGLLEAEAGGLLQGLIRFSVQKELTGLEPFAGIPGTVGGGLAMNAGAWGAELKDVTHAVTLMKENGEIVERPRPRLRFAYRRLKLPPSWIILKGSFQLRKGRREEILERIRSFSEMRRRMQSLDYPSAGSIFKNPEEGPAGKWIDEAGLKGLRMGGASVSERHANFIINLGKATAKDILGLIEEVERRVLEAKGILLEKEVKVVGEA